jgi:hypothetical protein
LPFALAFALTFASEQKSDNSSFFRMKNEKQELSWQEAKARGKSKKKKHAKIESFKKDKKVKACQILAYMMKLDCIFVCLFDVIP